MTASRFSPARQRSRETSSLHGPCRLAPAILLPAGANLIFGFALAQGPP